MEQLFTDEHERMIAGRAMTLLERIENLDSLEHGNRPTEEVEDIVGTWQDQFPSEEAFEIRLDQQDVTRDDCRRAISADRLAADEPIPEWIEVLEELLMDVQGTNPQTYPAFFAPPESGLVDEDADERVFGEVSAAIAAYARDQLPDDPVRDVLSEEAIGMAMEWLRGRFVDRFTRILFVEFKAFMAAHDRDLAFADPDEFNENPREYYDRYIEYLFSGGCSDLCQEYPMFARLLVTLVRQWNEHLVEFSERLRADRDRLSEQFGDGGELGSIAKIEPLAEDTHGDGRAVMGVTFDSGLTVVYKPRSVDAGVAFYDVLNRLDGHLPGPDFETPTYLARDGYGWMEWFESEECPDEAAVKRYYERVGALTCLAYFFEFVDCQHENLLTVGEQPILIDAETVLHPYFNPDRSVIQSGISALQDDSVLLTMLLPHRIDSVYGESVFDDLLELLSGFGVSSDEVTVDDMTNPSISATNMDVMSVDHEPISIDRSGNVPSVDGTDCPPDEYVPTIVDGFTETYETLLQLRDDGTLFDDIRPLETLESVENRIVYRPTMRYVNMISSLASRAPLRDGARFGAEIEKLAVPFCDSRATDSSLLSLYNAERQAISRFDPPRFTSRTDETVIRIDGEPVGIEADVSGIERCRRRIELATHEDMLEQVELIRGCFEEVPNPSRESTSVTMDEESDSMDDRQLQSEATALFDEIRDAAMVSNDTYHWASIGPRTEADRLTVRPVDASLYTGRCGIAVFSAALYRLTGERRFRSFTLDTLQPVRDSVGSELGVPALYNHGGGVGIGSVAYGLCLAGDLLDDETLLDDAVRTVEFLRKDEFQSDKTYDVIGGAAGSILGFLAAYDRTSDPKLVSAATECGEHLLDVRTSTENGTRVWKTLSDDHPLTGYAHGVGGIAYALSRLSDVTGEQVYQDAAMEALEFEAAAFSETEANWPDFREWSGQTYLDQWCHGRAGIGLARIGTAEYVSNELVTRGIDRAIEGFSTAQLGRYDHLCCGEIGRVEFLLEAADHREGSREAARKLLSDVISRQRENGIYRLASETNRVTDPTLFHGLAGIGYTMLRVIDPELFPSVLLWE